MEKYGEFDIAGLYNKSLKYMLAITIILFSVLHENTSYALGFFLGGIACLFNLKLMTVSLEGMVEKRTYSRAFFNGHYMLRLGIVLAVLVGAITLESVNLFTAVAGMLTVRVIATWEAFSKIIKGKRVWSD